VKLTAEKNYGSGKEGGGGETSSSAVWSNEESQHRGGNVFIPPPCGKKIGARGDCKKVKKANNSPGVKTGE